MSPTGSAAGGLPVLLKDLQQACGEAARAVAERFFPYDGPVEWSMEGA